MIRVQGSIPYPPTADARPIRQFAGSLRQLSGGLQQASGQLTATAAGATSSWIGQASQAFARQVGDRSKVVATVSQELTVAATALDVYAAAIDATSAAYSSAALAEHAARAGLPWTSGALAAALMAQKAAYTAFLTAGAACKGQLLGSNMRIAGALFLGVDAGAFSSLKDAVMQVWSSVSDLVGDPNADEAAQRDALQALDGAMWDTIPADAIATADDPSLDAGWAVPGLVAGVDGAAVRYESFADQIRGGAHPMDATLAALTHDTYRVEGWDDGGHVGEWRRVTDDQLPAGLTRRHFENERWNSGLRAALYTDGSGRYVLSFAGWNDQWGGRVPSDALNSLDQGLGGTPHQYNQALLLARRLHAAYGDDLVISGHSLGGSLAAYASMGTGAPAVTYNAAGLHPDNMRRASGLTGDPASAMANANIRNYRVDSDILTNLQEGRNPLGNRMPDAIGRQIPLADTVDRPSFRWSNPWDSSRERLDHSVEMHQMDHVMRALDEQRPWTADRITVSPPGPRSSPAPSPELVGVGGR